MFFFCSAVSCLCACYLLRQSKRSDRFCRGGLNNNKQQKAKLRLRKGSERKLTKRENTAIAVGGGTSASDSASTGLKNPRQDGAFNVPVPPLFLAGHPCPHAPMHHHEVVAVFCNRGQAHRGVLFLFFYLFSFGLCKCGLHLWRRTQLVSAVCHRCVFVPDCVHYFTVRTLQHK